jgi:hypothetical protein
MSTRHDYSPSTNSRKKGEDKGKNEGGLEGKRRVIFAHVKNRGKESPLPRTDPELERYRDTSGDDKYLRVASLRSEGKPLGVTAAMFI